MKFEELSLHPQILQALKKACFEQCMPVQSKALPVTLTGEDVMVQSKTGSGKTAVFVLTFLEKYLRLQENGLLSSCLIVAPTRELAQQISNDAKLLSCQIKDFVVGCFYGGVGYEAQEKLLKKKCNIYVGTPGRLLDFITSKKLDCKSIDTFVIDEADRLFDMGFLPDLKKIFSYLPPKEKRQTMLFSATLEERVRNLAWEYMNESKVLELEPDKITVEEITQQLYHVSKSDKFYLFLQLLTQENPKSALVFTNSRHKAEEVAKRLCANDFNADYLCGDLSQSARERALKNLKNGKTSILVATDVAARGLQIDNLPLVVNYDLPEDYENYVHRIGRTARAGKTGKAISLADEEFVYGLEAIEKYIKMKIPVIWPDNLPQIEDKSLNYKEPIRQKASVEKPKQKPSDKEKTLGSMTQEQRLEFYRQKYGFVPKEEPKKSHNFLLLWWFYPVALVMSLAVIVVGVIPSFILRIFSSKLSDKYLFFHYRLVANIVLLLTGVKVKISGKTENLKITDRPVCFVANHTSFLDIPAVVGPLKINCGFITKLELAFIPFFNLIIIAMHCVFINRKNLKQSVQSIRVGEKMLKKGISMLIFPEGTRSKTGKIAPFKPGSFRLATEAQALIVPLTIKGIRRAFEDRTKFIQKTQAMVCVGSVYDTKKCKNREETVLMIKEIEKEICSTYARLGDKNGK